MAENQLQAAIRIALGAEPDFCAWRNNTGVADHVDRYGRSQRVKYGLATGSADLIGVLAPAGRMVALEIKTGSGHVTPEQVKWLALVRRYGGFACVIRSVEEARAALQRAREGAFE